MIDKEKKKVKDAKLAKAENGGEETQAPKATPTPKVGHCSSYVHGWC